MRMVAVVAVLMIAGAACSKKTNSGSGSTTGGSSGAATKQVKIGFIGDLSSTYKELVASPYQAAQLAFDQFNSSQTAVHVTLVGLDSQGSPDQSPALAQKVEYARRGGDTAMTQSAPNRGS